MSVRLTYYVNPVMSDVNKFGSWFRPIVEASRLKKKVIAEEAGIDPVSFSRILNGAHGASMPTALALVRAINKLAGRELADEETARRLVAGIKDSGEIGNGLFSGLKRLSPEKQRIVRMAMEGLIDRLAEEDHDTDYIDEEEASKQQDP